MAKVNLETNLQNIVAQKPNTLNGPQVTCSLFLRVPEQDIEDWSFEAGDELEAVLVVTTVSQGS